MFAVRPSGIQQVSTETTTTTDSPWTRVLLCCLQFRVMAVTSGLILCIPGVVLFVNLYLDDGSAPGPVLLGIGGTLAFSGLICCGVAIKRGDPIIPRKKLTRVSDVTVVRTAPSYSQVSHLSTVFTVERPPRYGYPAQLPPQYGHAAQLPPQYGHPAQLPPQYGHTAQLPPQYEQAQYGQTHYGGFAYDGPPPSYDQATMYPPPPPDVHSPPTNDAAHQHPCAADTTVENRN